MSKTKKLRELFTKNGFFRIVGAHNGLTAKLIENAGFEGIWASSLEVSASHAVPDANVLTMSDYLNAAISMNDAVSIPVVVDVDQGYGNSTNVIRMIKKFETAGIAGVIMEDKKFPKQNSLLTNGRQELASIAEFAGKIMAAKNAQKDPNFMVMARVEALIAGWGQEEAMKRAKAYAEAGADAIMIHSKKSNPSEVLEFINNWENNVPIVIVPTKYPTLTEEKIQTIPKIKMVIYANHVIRSAVTSIKETLKEIKETGGIETVSNKLIPVKELFELQGTFEMKESEEKYLRTDTEPISVIIPAAGKPIDLKLKEVFLKDTPTCMLDIDGKPVLQRNLEIFNSFGINDINVVTGYCGDKIKIEGINIIKNEDYENKKALHSIMVAKDKMKNRTIIAYSDLIFDKDIILNLINKEGDIILVVDSSYKLNPSRYNKKLDLIKAKKEPILEERSLKFDDSNEIIKIGSHLDPDEANFEFIGMTMLSKNGAKILSNIYEENYEELNDKDFTQIIQKAIDLGNKVDCLEIHKGWAEIHTFDDYKNISRIISKRSKLGE
jgi:phosphoenolpyruvate phosphomutase